MDWNQVFTIAGTNIALILVSLTTTITLFIWARTESNTDRRNLESVVREDRKDMLTLLREIQNEIKEFHHILGEIERKNEQRKL